MAGATPGDIDKALLFEGLGKDLRVIEFDQRHPVIEAATTPPPRTTTGGCARTDPAPVPLWALQRDRAPEDQAPLPEPTCIPQCWSWQVTT